jgi:hypothetical protein
MSVWRKSKFLKRKKLLGRPGVVGRTILTFIFNKERMNDKDMSYFGFLLCVVLVCSDVFIKPTASNVSANKFIWGAYL